MLLLPLSIRAYLSLKCLNHTIKLIKCWLWLAAADHQEGNQPTYQEIINGFLVVVEFWVEKMKSDTVNVVIVGPLKQQRSLKLS